MDCISTVNFSILIHGEPKGSIVPSRGLRKGDPLFSYLFLLITEGLSSLLQDANDGGTLSGYEFAKTNLRVSHLLFADDSLIFCKANEKNYNNLKRILKLYERASG